MCFGIFVGYAMFIEKGTSGVFFFNRKMRQLCPSFIVINTKAWGPNKKLGRDVNQVINPLFKV